MDPKTTLRAVEGFIVVIVIGMASQVTVAGQSLDLTTPAGRAAAVTALGSAIVFAIRRAMQAP